MLTCELCDIVLRRNTILPKLKPAKERRPWRSTVAKHPERLSIELARLSGMSLDKIAAKYGIHRDAIWRHMERLSPEYRAALAIDVPLEELVERASKEAGSLLDHFNAVRSIAMRALIEASACGDRHAIANLSRAVTETLRERGKLTGEILQTPTIQNITNNATIIMGLPFWADLQRMLLDRLAPFPAALEAVLRGLEELEGTTPQPPPDLPPTALLEAPRAIAA